MNQKLKIVFYLGPKDGLIQYWDDVTDEFIYFDYENMTQIIMPDLKAQEYHIYRLTGKNDNEYIYGYDGVSKVTESDESSN